MSSLVTSSLNLATFFLLIAVTITIAFYCFHSGVTPSRVSPPHLFYLTDLVLPTIFFSSGVTPWRVSPGAVRPQWRHCLKISKCWHVLCMLLVQNLLAQSLTTDSQLLRVLTASYWVVRDVRRPCSIPSFSYRSYRNSNLQNDVAASVRSIS